MKYRAEIDGLRALAVLAVVFYHALPQHFPGGFIGVDIFFVISGFLITSLLIEELQSEGIDILAFYQRRIRRLFPTIIFVLISVLLVAWFVLLAAEYQSLGKHTIGGIGFVSNFILWSEAGYFDEKSINKPLLHLWSLAIEEQFYLAWPVLLAILWRWVPFRLAIVVALTIISFVFSINSIKGDLTAAFYNPLLRSWELLSGAVLAIGLNKHQTYSKITSNANFLQYSSSKCMFFIRSYCGNILSSLSAVAIISAVFLLKPTISFPGFWALIPVVSAIILILTARTSWFNQTVLMNPAAIWFGLISFPLYLWHWPIISLTHIVLGQHPDTTISLIAVLVSVMLAALTYYGVEKPIRRHGSNTKTTLFLISGMVFVGLLGSLVVINKGFHGRYSDYALVEEAVGDWEYPGSLIETKLDSGKHVFSNSSHTPEVIFLGDSHIEQYGPLMTNRAHLPSVFITGGGCPPIPRVDGECHHLFKRFKEVLDTNTINTIVIGAAFNRYLIEGRNGDKYDYYYRQNGTKTSLTTKKGKSLAKESFYRFISNLSKTYRVIVVLDNPADEAFDPKRILTGTNSSRPLIVSKLQAPEPSHFQINTNQLTLINEMRAELTAMEIELLVPSDIICPNGNCYSMSIEGRPIYSDKDHIRPWYILSEMNELVSMLKKI